MNALTTLASEKTTLFLNTTLDAVCPLQRSLESNILSRETQSELLKLFTAVYHGVGVLSIITNTFLHVLDIERAGGFHNRNRQRAYTFERLRNDLRGKNHINGALNKIFLLLSIHFLGSQCDNHFTQTKEI